MTKKSNMVVGTTDFYGVSNEFPIIDTGPCPPEFQYRPDIGTGGKVKVVFINSKGYEESTIVNSDRIHLSLRRIQEIKAEKRRANSFYPGE